MLGFHLVGSKGCQRRRHRFGLTRTDFQWRRGNSTGGDPESTETVCGVDREYQLEFQLNVTIEFKWLGEFKDRHLVLSDAAKVDGPSGVVVLVVDGCANRKIGIVLLVGEGVRFQLNPTSFGFFRSSGRRDRFGCEEAKVTQSEVPIARATGTHSAASTCASTPPDERIELDSRRSPP